MENIIKQNRGSMGGQVMAIRQRKEALAKYYLNPNKCKLCESIIHVPDSAKIPSIKLKKFCNKSCAAKFNNSGINRHKSKEKTELDISYPTKHPRKPNVIPRVMYNDNISISSISKGDLFDKRSTWIT